MPELLVDGRPVVVRNGATLLDAAESLGIAIPTLCFREGLPHQASCMVCLVEDERSGRLVPACATEASPDDRIRTDTGRVRAARRRSLQMLLAEHDGDCEAPCTRACPAHADIPAAIRRISWGAPREALAVLMDRLPLAWTLAHICPAPCRQSCRRKRLDTPIDICSLKRAAAEPGLAGADPFTPPALPSTGKRVAVVGAGPAGLSAAYFLARDGHACTVFESREGPGGAMTAPAEALEADVGVLHRLGVEFRFGRTVGTSPDLRSLRATCDAVVLATGSRTATAAAASGAPGAAGVFACGNARFEQPTRLAVRSVADGRRAALAVASFLAGSSAEGERRRFDSRRAALSIEELGVLAARSARRPAAPGAAAAEAARCLDCDCRRKASCRLRGLADEFDADASRFAGPQERHFELVVGSAGLSLEPGKCIRCGICVRIAEAAGDRPGLAFSLRGAGVRIRVPFGEDIDRALPTAASACVAACPTGALAWDTAGASGERA